MDIHFKSITYTTKEGIKTYMYDPNYPCIMCELPVVEASIGGTAVCQFCDIGVHRSSTPWTYKETIEFARKAFLKNNMQILRI